MSAILSHHRWILQFLSIVMIFSLNIMEQCEVYIKERCIISMLKEGVRRAESECSLHSSGSVVLV